jgi:cold shock CspA family protein
MHKGSGSSLKGAGVASSTLPLPLFAIVRAIPPPDASVKRIVALIMFGSMLGWATDVSARTLGHVTFYNPDKGIGFFARVNGESISFHKSDWAQLCPNMGVKVSFEIERRARGLVATQINVVSGMPASCGGSSVTGSPQQIAEPRNETDIAQIASDPETGETSESSDSSDEATAQAIDASEADEADASAALDDSEDSGEQVWEPDQEGLDKQSNGRRARS